MKPVFTTGRLRVLVDHLTVEVVTQEDRFRSLENEWTELFNKCPHVTPYQSFCWNMSMWKAAGGNDELAVCTVRENGRLVGIAPLVRKHRLGVSVLEPMGSHNYAYFGVIIEQQRSDVAHSMAECLASQYPDGMIHIPYHTSSQQDLVSLLYALSARGWATATWVRNVSHFVECRGDYASYLAAKPSKSRYNLKRERRVLEDVGPVRLEACGGPELTAEMLQRVALLQRRSRLSRVGQQPLTQGNLMGVVMAMSKNGLSEIYILTVGGTDVAYMWNYTAHGKNFCNMIGFDDGWERFSPGKVMAGMVLERLLSRSDHHFDFLFGENPYKKFWMNRTHHVARSVSWRGCRGWVLSVVPHRLHGFATRHDALRRAARGARDMWWKLHRSVPKPGHNGQGSDGE
jgi:CelD/BcsL family acetyltransferase involved in cellulose biosynthesis